MQVNTRTDRTVGFEDLQHEDDVGEYYRLPNQRIARATGAVALLALAAGLPG